MPKRNLVILIGGLLVAVPFSGAMSQDLASAPPAAPIANTDVMVFLDSGNNLPAAARDSVLGAAEAAKSGRTVHIEGQQPYANVVKQELLRQGAPAQAIVVQRATSKPLARLGDGLGDPTQRRVELKF